MHARKTGAMIRASAVAGAIMAGADEGVVAAVDRYGAEIGLAFQIVDDILDVEGSAQRAGQDRGQGRGRREADLPGALRRRALAGAGRRMRRHGRARCSRTPGSTEGSSARSPSGLSRELS